MVENELCDESGDFFFDELKEYIVDYSHKIKEKEDYSCNSIYIP